MISCWQASEAVAKFACTILPIAATLSIPMIISVSYGEIKAINSALKVVIAVMQYGVASYK